MVNYNEISRVYDQVRAVDRTIIERFLAGVTLDASSIVLDIGCGTGSYSGVLAQVSQAQVYGLDPSEAMLAQARAKYSQVEAELRQGDICATRAGETLVWLQKPGQ